MYNNENNQTRKRRKRFSVYRIYSGRNKCQSCFVNTASWNAGSLKMPVWAFHGMQDNVVSPNHTIEMIEVLKITNHNVKCDLYEGVGHDSWNKAFSEETLKWLLQQKRNLDKIHP